MNQQTNQSHRWLTLAACTAMLCACINEPAMPAMDGAVIEIRRSGRSLAKGDAGFERTLQLYWFGSGCHLIQLGELSVLTDPFVTNGLQLVNNRSDPKRVGATFAKIRPPTAILINHSHIDHLLDAYAALSLADWKKNRVPLYGGLSARNILAGWKDADALDRCHVVSEQGGEVLNRKLPAGYNLHVTAYPSRHGRHLKCGLTLFGGKVAVPRTTPPSTLADYEAGEVFNYLITLKHHSTTFRIFHLGAVADPDEFPGSLPPSGTNIDVVILCVPGAKNLDSSPGKHLARLRPRHIVLSHFNTLLKENPDRQLAIGWIDLVKIDDLSRDIQSGYALRTREYPEFETLQIPAITIMEAYDQARNVITIR